jgi:hypothetical protein
VGGRTERAQQQPSKDGPRRRLADPRRPLPLLLARRSPSTVLFNFVLQFPAAAGKLGSCGSERKVRRRPQPWCC